MILDKIKERFRTKLIKKQSEILFDEFITYLLRTHFMPNQKRLNSLQLEYIKLKLEQMLPEHAYKCYTSLDILCKINDIEPPISLLKLKNLKDYLIEQKLKEIEEDFK